MTPEDRVADALHSPQPIPALRALVQDLASEGSSKLERRNGNSLDLSPGSRY